MKNTLLFICLLAIAAGSCKKSTNSTCYGLVSPVNAPENVSPVFTSFSWLNCSNMPADVVLSANRDYSKPVFNKEAFTQSLKADTVLFPFTKYYWIVTVKGQEQSYADSFTTGGVSAIISGNYAGTGRNNNYAFIHDTTYSYALTVHDAGDDKISLQLPGIDSVVFSKISTTDSTIVYTCKPCTGKYNGFKNLVYHPNYQGIVITFQTGSVNFDEWDFTGLRQP